MATDHLSAGSTAVAEETPTGTSSGGGKLKGGALGLVGVLFMAVANAGVNESRRPRSVPISPIGVTWPTAAAPRAWQDAGASLPPRQAGLSPCPF